LIHLNHRFLLLLCTSTPGSFSSRRRGSGVEFLRVNYPPFGLKSGTGLALGSKQLIKSNIGGVDML
jgi:hypothetical protein